MGIFDKIKGAILRKKDNLESPMGEGDMFLPNPIKSEFGQREPQRNEFLPPTPMESLAPAQRYPSETEKIDMTNMRAKLDLIITQVDSVRSQNQIINERLNAIERMLAELRGVARY
jgi:hypothetical protein